MSTFSAAASAAAVPERPRLKPWLRRADTPDALVLEHGQTAIVFEGTAARALLPVLLPLLDGTRTRAELAARLDVAGHVVEHALAALAERRLLLDGPGLSDDEPALVVQAVELLASLDRSASVPGVRDRLRAARVDLLGSGPSGPLTAEILHASGVGTVRQGRWSGPPESVPTLTLVAAGAAEAHHVARWNRRALDHGWTWFQLLPYDGRFAAIGPLYVPGETCCYACFRARRRATSGYPREFGAVEDAPVAAPTGAALDAVVAGVAASLVLRWLAFDDHAIPGVFHACEGAGTALTQHRVYRVPRCSACSGLHTLAPPLPWYKETTAVSTTARPDELAAKPA